MANFASQMSTLVQFNSGKGVIIKMGLSMQGPANTAPLSEDKRATNCTTFPTSDALCISADGPVTENPTSQHQEARQNLDNDLGQENSVAQALTGRAASSGKRPARHPPETEVRDGKRVASPFCQEGAPWPKYHQFATLGTSGTTFLAVDPMRQSPRIVAVKEVKTFDLKLAQSLMRIVHQNIVALHEAWLSSDKFYLVYERMDITLDRLQQFHQFKEEHISTVLNALAFVHNELQVNYVGSIYDHVYFSYDGSVKLGMDRPFHNQELTEQSIGNIGASLLSNYGIQEGDDIKSIGTMMLRIMQPGTMHRNPNETYIQRPRDWSDTILGFLKATREISLKALLSHPFVTATSVDRAGFISMIWTADKKVRTPPNRPKQPETIMSAGPIDKEILRDKRLRSRGRAKVSLKNLQYHGISSRGEVNDKHVNRLAEVFRAEGCARLHDPNHYVPAVISPEDLRDALVYSEMRLLDLMQDGEPRTLYFRRGIRIRVLHGEHRLRAAEQFLEPTEQWWTVDLYTTELSEATQQCIREEYSHQLEFTDGDIYRKIRFYERTVNEAQADKWRARLSSTKLRNLKRLDKDPYKALKNAFDENIPFVGLWDDFLLGSFNRLFHLRCPEELEHYVRHIHKTWSFICQDQQLFNLVDSHTVQVLETLAPTSKQDKAAIELLAESGGIFSTIDRATVLEHILPRLIQVPGRIPSFFTFFQDTRYLEACVDSLRPLLPPELPREVKTSTRQSFYHCFADISESPGTIKIQTGENKFRSVYASPDERKKLSYLMIFLAAMRDFPALSQIRPRQSRGENRPSIEGSAGERRPYLASLALDFGFRAPQILALVDEDPTVAASRAFIHRSYPIDQYEVDTERADTLAWYMAEEMSSITSPRDRRGPPRFFSYHGVPKKLRCGLPDNINYKKDRKHLFLDIIYRYDPPTGEHLTSLAFQRDIFKCFFGTHKTPGGGIGIGSSEDKRGDQGKDYSHAQPDTGCENANSSTCRRDEDLISLLDCSSPDNTASPPVVPLVGRTSTIGSSNYGTRSSSELSSRPMSDLSDYLRSIEEVIWRHSQVPGNMAASDNQPLAPGFERSLSREMNMFHPLEADIRPSEAVNQFLLDPPLIVVYLWRERKYIKFWPTQRWDFEEAVCSLADCGMSFAIFLDDEIVVTGVAGLWAAAQRQRLVLAGPKSTATRVHDAARPVDSFLDCIDELLRDQKCSGPKVKVHTIKLWDPATGALKHPIRLVERGALLIKELLIKELLIKELLIKELLIKELLIKELLIKELLIEGLLITGLLIEGLLIEGLLIEGLLIEGLLIEGLLIEGLLSTEPLIIGPLSTRDGSMGAGEIFNSEANNIPNIEAQPARLKPWLSIANLNVECLLSQNGRGSRGHWYHAKIGLGEVHEDKAYDENYHNDGLGGRLMTTSVDTYIS
ncbi:hypothetical protein CNMCM8980_005533 [Aspergillus fumigatiaffinis]|nr:hypothetical protein CNMCM8980_005533 [Aspergillus fumigatiaffinis]